MKTNVNFGKNWRMKKSTFLAFALVGAAIITTSCGIIRETVLKNNDTELWSFGQDMAFCKKYGVETLLLSQDDTIVAVSPALQGRVLTSSFAGMDGASLGWINRVELAYKKSDLQKVQLGGEDRFWVGPQGGENSIFFPVGSIVNESSWRIPAFLTSESWNLVAKNAYRAKFEKSAEFENIKGTKFKVKAEREVSVLNRKHAADILGVVIPENVKMVAFQSFNKLTNMGSSPWTAKTGLLNISTQSCFNANRKTNAFVPYRAGEPAKLGDIVRDNFYGASLDIDNKERLVVDPSFIAFRTDGKRLSYIGVSSRRSEGIALSYDDANAILTVIFYIKPTDVRAYLQSSWRKSVSEYDGDAISVFNNGPVAGSNAPADAYYEISSYSPALALESGKSQFHLQRTFHFHGSEFDLGQISTALVGLSINQLRQVKKP